MVWVSFSWMVSLLAMVVLLVSVTASVYSGFGHPGGVVVYLVAVGEFALHLFEYEAFDEWLVVWFVELLDLVPGVLPFFWGYEFWDDDVVGGFGA